MLQEASAEGVDKTAGCEFSRCRWSGQQGYSPFLSGSPHGGGGEDGHVVIAYLSSDMSQSMRRDFGHVLRNANLNVDSNDPDINVVVVETGKGNLHQDETRRQAVRTAG